MIFSYSRLNTYERCNYRFYRKYILKEEEQPKLPLSLGKATHKAIESLVKGANEHEAITEGIIEVDFFPGVTYDEVAFLARRANVQPHMGQTEVHFTLPLSDEKNAPLVQGYIDLLQFHAASITDWKTNRSPYDVLGTYQMGLYCWAMSKIYGTPYFRGTLFFLRYRKSSTHLFTSAEMDRARLWALQLAKEINTKITVHDMLPEKAADIFPASPSGDCKHCSFAVECMKEFSVKTLKEG